MEPSSLGQFECPSAHETVSAIIRRRSINKIDVRRVALRGLDLTSASHVLDLGCGFGFMSEALAGRAAPDARVVGVDACPSNEGPFLERIAATGRRSEFVCMTLGRGLPWADRTFDVVACCYSLYFFAGVLPEVARVLTREGLFLAITHTEGSFRDVFRLVGEPAAAAGMNSLARAFSAENGEHILRQWFGEVKRIDYRNALRFENGHLDELLTYLRFKFRCLLADSTRAAELLETQCRAVQATLAQSGHVLIRKDDAVFQCRKPLCL